MKYFSKILLAAMAALPLVSCTKDEVVKGEPENDSYGVYFETLQESQKSTEFDPSDPAELEFKAFRIKDTDDITVPLVIRVKGGDGETDPTSYFSTSELFFEDGATETTFKVQFPDAPLGQTFKVEVACEDYNYIKIYSPRPTSFSFEVTRVKWSLVTGPNGEQTGTWTDDLFSTMYPPNDKGEGLPHYNPVNDRIKIYQRDDKPGLFKIIDVYDANMIAAFFNVSVDKVNPGQYTPGTVTIIDATNPEKVWMPLQNSGAWLNKDDSYLMFGSLCQKNGFSQDAFGTYDKAKGIIHFPAGTLLASFPALASQGKWFLTNKSGLTKITLPGYGN